jgi:hypothetical protein
MSLAWASRPTTQANVLRWCSRVEHRLFGFSATCRSVLCLLRGVQGTLGRGEGSDTLLGPEGTGESLYLGCRRSCLSGWSVLSVRYGQVVLPLRGGQRWYARNRP